MNRKPALIAAVLSLAMAATALASWYDDYDAGLLAARRGEWSQVVEKMSAAIKGNAKENNRARTYGTITINYHPYYYRGVAYLNLGRYDDAIADFERTSGPGPENMGSLDTLMERAKRQQSASSEPAPAPVRTEPARPAVSAPAPVPAAPQIDPALRQRATSALAGARQKLQAAQQRRASDSPQYSSAMGMYTDAASKSATAKNNDDLQAAIALAENAGDIAELAMPPNASAPAPAVAAAPSTRPAVAAENVLADYKQQLRRALEAYFNGDFEDAERAFERLSKQLPDNGWIFAFLGASQYSRYAFETDPVHRDAAIRSFQKAKRLRNWRGGLPERYFSRRIRKAFAETAG